jgi:hypothetical protein
MGIVKRKIELENYLDSIGVKWYSLSDKEYIHLVREIKKIIDSEENYLLLHGDRAYLEFENRLPFSGYIYSIPGHPLLSIYNGADEITIAYRAMNIRSLDRQKINSIECLFSDCDLNYAILFNHEWDSMCPEMLIKKNA